MGSKIFYRLRDNSDEYTTFEYEVADATALNFDTLFTGGGSVLGTMQTALLGCVVGNLATIGIKLQDTTVNDVRPASGFAQRETAVKIYGQDANGKLYTRSFGTADLANLAVGGQDELNLAAAPFSAMVTAMNDSWQVKGQDLTVLKAVIIGRAN